MPLTWIPLDYVEGDHCNLPSGESLIVTTGDPLIVEHVLKVSDDKVELRAKGYEINMDQVLKFAQFNLPS